MQNTALVIFLILSSSVIACGGAAAPSPTAGARTPAATRTAGPPVEPTESPRHGIEGLIADLKDAGVEATVGETFDGQPMAIQQTIVCADGEDVRVFVYGTEQDRAAFAARIDPDDPSNIGTAIVEWDGWPKFWQRDRIIVLYLGRDQATVGLLTQLMGDPFAEGQNQPQRLPGGC